MSEVKLLCSTFGQEDLFTSKFPALTHFFENFAALPGNKKFL